MTLTTESQDFIPVGGSFFKIPSSSNLRWLIMFYALPRELVEKRPAFLSMPRKVREVVHSEKWMQLVNSDMFLELVWDCYAWVSWQFSRYLHRTAAICLFPVLSICTPATSRFGGMPT